MKRRYFGLALGLLLCAVSQAATVNTTMTVNATGAFGTSSITAAGTANLTGIGNNLAFSGSMSLTPGPNGYVATFTITVNSTDKINGTLNIPASVLAGTGNASATITGGTGAYAGATGTFPTLDATGSGLGSTGALTLKFTGSGTITTGGTGGGGGGGGATGPAVTEVLDAGSYTKNIAQGSIFVVKGTNLSASGFTQLSFPLPTQSSGVKITFTQGTSNTDAYLVYLYNQSGVNQLAAVLPSTLAAGAYNMTVTNNGAASAPVAVTVVQRKPGLITANSAGSGLAVLQNFVSASQLDIDRLTTFASGGFTFSPAKPGQVVIAWATGMGPITGSDNTASPGFDFNANGVAVRVLVGGTTITPAYAGRAPGLAGADQINFTLPSNVPTGCSVPFQISVNGVLSNASYISIAPDANSSTCVSPGLTSTQLQKLDGGGSITTGAFSITQFQLTVPQVGTVKSNAIAGGFSQITSYNLDSASQNNVSLIQQGSCYVSISSAGGSTSGSVSVNYLDAGNVTVTGPSGSGLTNQALTKTGNVYSLSNTEGLGVSIPGQVNFTLPAGTYTLNGAGGNDVGSFNTSTALSTALTITGGLPSTVTKSAGLTLNWTGGNTNDLVEIVGGATTGSGANTVTTSFICLTTAGQRTFTVPASILTQLPNTTAGSLEVASGNFSTTFTAPLRAGGSIDQGVFGSFMGVGNSPTYQ